MFLRTIEKMRERPEDERWAVTIIASLAVTSLIVGVWFAAGSVTGTYAEKKADNEDQLASPFAAIEGDAGRLYDEARKEFEGRFTQ